MNVKSAWYLMQRLRAEMQPQDECNLLKGIIEADETFVGGKPSSQYKNKGKGKRGRGTKKMIFLGAIQRGGKVVLNYSTRFISTEVNRLEKPLSTSFERM